MPLQNIDYNSEATSEVLNNNFQYLESNIQDSNTLITTLSSTVDTKIANVTNSISSNITTTLETIYPVGSIYISITDTCPLASLFGTWEIVSSGRVLQGADSSHSAGSTIAAGLPNIKGYAGNVLFSTYNISTTNGAMYCYSAGDGANNGGGYARPQGYIDFSASRSSSIFGNSSTVQPPAYVVNIWRRTA